MKTKRMMILCSLVLSGFVAMGASPGGEPVAKITVSAGDTARSDAIVSVALPDRIKVEGGLSLVEITSSGRRPVASQIGNSRPPRLWWVLDGNTPAKGIRRYELEAGKGAAAEGVTMRRGAKTLDALHGKDLVFQYNHAPVEPPEGVGPEFTRSAYINPLFSPGGKLLTEDFPADHYHHKGIWFPWTSTEFDGKKIDFWNLGKKEGTVRHVGYGDIESGPVFGRFVAKHEFVDLTQNKVALNETWEVTLYGTGGKKAGMWIFDLRSRQSCASKSPLLLKKYRYGGMGYRGPKEWKGDNYVVLSSEGKTKKDGHTTRAKWCAHSGSIDGTWITVVVMGCPKNLRFPEPMRIWPKGGCFFNYTLVQAGDLEMVPDKEYTFTYRFFVHEGKIDAERAERAWQDFGNPPVAKIE